MTINRITAEDIDYFVENPGLDIYQEIAKKSAIYPGRNTALGLAYVALKLNGEAGELAEHVGKAMRDDDLSEYIGESENGKSAFYLGELTPERENLIIKELGDVLWYISAACNELGITLEQVATANLLKLHDRTERNKLQGSGDNR